jgi:hypothetical protein
MKNVKNFLITATIIISALAVSAGPSAADFEDDLQNMAENNGKLYLQPMVNALSIDLNSGLYHTAKVHGLLGFDVGIKTAMVFVPSDAKTFDFILPETQSMDVGGYQITINLDDCKSDEKVPTVLGDKDPVKIVFRPDGMINGNRIILVSGRNGHSKQVSLEP